MAITLLAACGSDSTSQPGDTHADSDVSSCQSTCDDEGARACSGDAVRECTDANDDGCLEWVELLTCGTGTTCVDGTCGLACPNAPCSVAGAKRCEGTLVATCGDSDSDGCLDWGATAACDDGLVCANGFCALSCTDTCTAVGAKKCEGNAVVTCGDHDADGCLEWGATQACGGGETCSSGFCATTCTDECTTSGATRCDGNGVVTCGQFDGDACLEWGTVVACNQGEVCSNGACATSCTSECSTIGAKTCDGQSVLTCEDPDQDGCFTWSSPVPCGAGLACASGQCASTCTDDCTVVGAKACDLGGRVVTCGQFDSDPCLEWSSGVACDSGLVCSAGHCALSCTSTCAAVGQRQCAAGSSNYQVCGDYNADGCLEWGTAQACGGSLVCNGGQCETTCSNTCATAGTVMCDGNATRTCGDFNSDGCLEYGTPAPCALTESCTSGVCQPLAPPATVRINEVVVNSVGSPDLDTFLELHAPAGTNLAGYTVVGINGSGGGAYVTISLAGVVGSDGLWVIAHPQAHAAITDMADQLHAGVDFQNGPDSIQVRFGATVTDALGYGTFGANDVFAGEGTAAPAPDVDQALARDENHTDTNDNAIDFRLVTPTPGLVNGAPNRPPVAVLSCPSSVTANSSREISGAGSGDPDGTLVSYRFEFGDNTPVVTGVAATVTHAWTNPGNYTVRLRVTDDGGLTAETTCQVAVVDGNGPAVLLVKPADQLQVTQGSVVPVLADATPTAGRSITSVTFWANGVQFGSDDGAPFEATYTVPAQAATGSTVAIEARATDSTGAIGVSPVKTLRVANDPPVAAFTATVTGPLQVTADASASYDTETAAAALEVRWDWQNDGTWDTNWSTTKLVTYTYPSEGVKTIKLQVRDAVGQISEGTRSVDVALLQTVSGTVNTTTWTGTIIITGDVVVPAGQTLTIAAGTTVLFAPVDQAGDGTGDYDILVQGMLNVAGTAAAPVVFTTYGTQAKRPKDWNSIILRGAGSTVAHAVIEYADVGLTIEGAATVSDVEVRQSRHGIVFTGSGTGTVVQRANVHDNTSHGVVSQSSHNATLAHTTLRKNGGAGAYASANSTLGINDSIVRENAFAGLEYIGTSKGTVTRNLVTANGYEGLRLAIASGNGPVVTINNIYGNATVGARVVQTIAVTATSSVGGTSTATSASWSAPGGESIEFVFATYSETDSTSNYVVGHVDRGMTSVWSSGTATEAWVDVSSAPTASVRARVTDTHTSYSGSLAITRAAYTKLGAVAEVSVVGTTNTDLRHNHWGVFTNPLTVAQYGFPAQLNIQGFRGEAYAATWVRAPWVGGETLSASTSWSGTVYVTGTVTTTSAATLTIEQGANIVFAPVDQNADGTGDYSLTLSGPLVVQGASANKVRFTSMATSPAPGDWNRITAANGIQMSHAIVEYGNIGLHVTSTTTNTVIADSEFHSAKLDGLSLTSVRDGSLARVTSRDNGRTGVVLTATSGTAFAIDRLIARDNGAYGLHALNSATGVTVTHSRFTNNGAAGLYCDASALAVSQSELSYNLEGARYRRNSAGSLASSEIKYNDREGLVLLSVEASNPTPAITGNNIYGNSVVESGVLAQPDVNATSTTGGTSTATSTAWTPPANQAIRYFEASYTENDSSSNYVTGLVISDSTATLASTATAMTRRYYDIWDTGVASLRARVTDTHTSYSGSMTIHQVLHDGGTAPKELVALITSGTVNVTGNYWGVFPNVQERMTLGRSNAVDFQGFQVGTINGTGPQ